MSQLTHNFGDVTVDKIPNDTCFGNEAAHTKFTWLCHFTLGSAVPTIYKQAIKTPIFHNMCLLNLQKASQQHVYSVLIRFAYYFWLYMYKKTVILKNCKIFPPFRVVTDSRWNSDFKNVAFINSVTIEKCPTEHSENISHCSFHNCSFTSRTIMEVTQI